MNLTKTIKTCIPILLLLFLTGCFALPTEAPALPPPVLRIAQSPHIPTEPVARGSVQMTANPQAVYVPVREERLQFEAEGIPIQGIFVTAGDQVTAGDVIAALYMPEVTAELNSLHRTRDDLQLRLSQVNERRALALAQAETSGIPIDDAHFLQTRANILTDLEILQMDIDHMQELNSTRYLRATMNGVVNSAAPFVVNMQSQPRQTIATITDHTYTAFVITTRAADFMHPGDYFDMTLGGGTFLMQVVCPDEFNFTRSTSHRYEAFLIFVDSPPTLREGDRGNVHVLFDEVQDVLYIPAASLRRVGEYRTFVYVMENDVRTIRDVVIGLEGDRHIEIISGLTEGELVVTR